MSRTLDRVTELASELARTAPTTHLGEAAAGVVRRAGQPLRLAIAGRMKAGKSTLLNAIVGEPLAATDAAECTRVVTAYRAGTARRAVVVRHDGSSTPALLQRDESGMHVDLAGVPLGSIHRLDVEWPARVLDRCSLIDTPGLGSLDATVSHRGVELVADHDPDTAVDAVLYLTHHAHPGDWRFLTAFHDDAGVHPDPACAAAVLSRADEVAGGRPDALDVAARLAHAHSSDPAVRRYCRTVLPVAGLLAQGAAVLTDRQFRSIGRLAVDEGSRDALVTAERFVTLPDVAGTTDHERSELLDQLGLFGVRTAVDLVRRGTATTTASLASELRSLSGLDAVLQLVDQQFIARRNALRARTAIRVLRAAAESAGPAGSVGSDVLARLERIEAEDHDLAELAVVAAARSGSLAMSDTATTELERLLDPLPPPMSRQQLLDELERWRARGAHPLASPDTAAAAEVVARNLERRIAADPTGRS